MNVPSNVEHINASLDHVAAVLRDAGIEVTGITPATGSADGGLTINDRVSVAVGADASHVTVCDPDGFTLGQSRSHDDTSSLVRDICSALQ